MFLRLQEGSDVNISPLQIKGRKQEAIRDTAFHPLERFCDFFELFFDNVLRPSQEEKEFSHVNSRLPVSVIFGRIPEGGLEKLNRSTEIPTVVANHRSQV